MTCLQTHFARLSKLAEVATLGHQIISNNLANVNPPGYHRMVVKFEEVLSEELRKPGPVNTAGLKPEIFEELAGPMRVDGNNVDINKETGDLSKNALLYNTYLQILSIKMDTMRRAIG